MSKRKGVSLEEKRTRLLSIYHTDKCVFNLKEMEKLGTKKGVVTQTIKDVNQGLVDDCLIDTDKIGAGVFFWSFPSKLSQQKKAKLEKITEKLEATNDKTSELQKKIESAQKGREVTNERTDKLKLLKEMQAHVKEMEDELQILKENDPATIQKLEGEVNSVMKEGANRWTDNLFNLQSWVVKRQGCTRAEANKWLGITDDMDYID